VLSEQEGQIHDTQSKYLSFGEKKIVKIGPVDPQIIGLQSKKKEISGIKTYI